MQTVPLGARLGCEGNYTIWTAPFASLLRKSINVWNSWSPCLMRPVFTGMVKSHIPGGNETTEENVIMWGVQYIYVATGEWAWLLLHPGSPSLAGEGLQHFQGPPRKEGEKFHHVSKLDRDCHLLTHSWNDQNCAVFPDRKTEQKQEKS